MTDREVSKVDCTWCYYGQRRESVPARHVALFACIREHMTARALCGDCATSAANRPTTYICEECAAAGVDEDHATCEITLVTTREDWMGQVKTGRIRMLVRP